MRANTGMSLAQKAKTNVSFSEIINSPSNRNLIEKTLKDPERATRLVATLVAAVADSDNLKKCKPETIISCALKGEANNLSLSLQQFYLVPYGNVCTYISSHKGLLQLAVRTGQYEEIDAFDVREGEYKGRDSLSGRPKFDFISDEERREQLPIIGYYAFFRLKNGFFKGVYWSMDKLLEHADRYSRAFDMATYKKYINKQPLTQDEQRQVDNGPWYGKTGAQEAMCRKTVLKNILNSGYAPLSAELVEAMASDDDEILNENSQRTYDAPTTSYEVADDEPEENGGFAVNSATGEVLDSEAMSEDASKEKSSRAKKTAPKEDRNAYDAFFGGDA